jgi:hypothetical protein
MYLRVDPSQSALSDLFVIDMDASYTQLFARVNPDCASGQHKNLPTAILITSQSITCVQTGAPLNTLIYKI